MNNYKIQTWDCTQFKNSRTQWSKLLKQANCDQLFLSWEWLYTWWNTFGNLTNNKLLLITVHKDNNLVGIAPLFITKITTRKLITTRRLQPLGNYWRGQETMRTELFEFITEQENEKSINQCIFDYIYSLKIWDELVFVDFRIDSKTYETLVTSDLYHKCLKRTPDYFESYYTKTTGDFEQYIQSLGKNTRLKIYNRRKRLQSLGTVKFLADSESSPKHLLDLLNKLHQKRWGTPIFQDLRFDFNLKLSTLMYENKRLAFSILFLDNTAISIQYNIDIDGHIYNIQSGFDESIDKKLAPGYLHFGYAIEDAYNRQKSIYDFLAGEGKKTQYKAHLTRNTHTLCNIQLIRNPLLKLLYLLYDKLRK